MADSIFTGRSPDPARLDLSNPTPITVGTGFIPAVDGSITQIGWYTAITSSTVAPVARLWHYDSETVGTALATKAITSPPGGGWVWITLDAPVAVVAGQRYVVGVRTDRYVAKNFELSAPIVSGNLTAWVSGSGSVNGRFHDNDPGPDPTYPSDSFQSTAYFVDVVFQVGPVDVVIADRASAGRALDTAGTVTAGTAVADVAGPPARALDTADGLTLDTGIADRDVLIVRAINPAAGVVIGAPPPSAATADRAIMPMLERLLALYKVEAAKVAAPAKYASIRAGVAYVASQGFTANGEVYTDEVREGSIWLRVVNAYPTSNFPAQETAFHNEDMLSLAVVVEVGVARAIPYQGLEDDPAPTSDQHIAAATMILDDVAAMRRTYKRLREADYDAVMGQYQPIPSEANAGGGTMHITVRVPFCDQ